MLKLRIEDDEGQETIVPIIRDEITIGRQEGNTIRLTERNVSRRHAKLVREGDELWLEEISARYGTLKNGQKLAEKRTAFRVEDQFQIGDYSLTLQTDAPVRKPEPDTGFAAEQTAIKPLSDGPRRAQEGTEVLPAMPAKLVIISSNFAGQEFPLARKEMLIGRGEDCDIIIDHRSVSQRHAKIIRESGTVYQIVDLNSKNGIRIGGEKYTSTYIKRGDVVELGHVKFRFVEPGENYVFTPSSVDDEETQYVATPQKSSKAPLFIVAALVVIALIGGAAVMLTGDDKGSDTSSDTTEPAVATTTTTEPDAAQQDEPAATTAGNDKIAQGISRAKEQLDSGDVEKAIGILEGLEYADPDPKEKEQISALLLEAKNERPFQDTYRSIEGALGRDEYIAVLKQLPTLPEHTLFGKLAKKNEFETKAREGVVTSAKSMMADNQSKEATEALKELLEVSPGYAPAQDLLDEMAAKSAAVKVASKQTSSKSSKSNTKSSKPAKPKITKEEAKALHKSANSKMFSGDNSGAISDCKKALDGGITDCYRVMGIAYKKEGNTSSACRNFKRALKYSPSMANGIRRQIDELGCEE